jgi:hypothetical protein
MTAGLRPRWLARARCWVTGHDIRQTGRYAWACAGCDRASRPVKETA